MTTSDPISPRTTEASASKHTDVRTQRGVRFSDSEWEYVKEAAIQLNIPAGEFVRNASLRAAEGQSSEDSGPIPPSLVELMKHTYRYVYILSTLKRDEMTRDGRRREVDQVIELARKAQSDVLSGS